MKKSLRIGYNRYYCDKNFKEHIEFIKKNAEHIDEITLFVEFCHHSYWDKDFIDKTAEILTDRIKRYKEIGIQSVGINVLCTRGHTEDGWDLLPKSDLQYETNENGEVSKSHLCIAGDDFKQYTKYKYATLTKTGADFIWSDDDLQVSNCYCDECIRQFNEAYGYHFDRKELAETERKDRDLAVQRWNFVLKNTEQLYTIIADAIHEVNPKTKIGYMSIWGNDIPEWAEASRAVKGRPGGGFYDERTPIAVFDKYLSVQLQLQSYPERITDIQYEYEAFNYQTLDRSIHFTELESTLALMAGCNGVLYNNDIFYDRQPLIDMLAASSKKWDVLTEKNKNLKPTGVYCVGRGLARTLCELGIPVTLDFENAVAYFVLGDGWNTLNEEKIKTIFQKGAMTDGRGLEVLWEKGYGKFCGGKVKKVYLSGMAERFAEHTLCGDYQNHYRDAFMNFAYYINNSGSAYEFDVEETAQVVSNLETITHEKLGCSLYISDNGNRFAADGYFFINSTKTHGKKAQIGNVLDWISGEKLPVKTPETIKIMPAVQADDKGNMTLMLTNASFDNTGRFQCELRSDKPVYVIGKNGELKSLEQTTKSSKTIVTIENINSWDYILLTNMK